MKILLIPFLITITPIVALFFVLRHLGKTKKISALLKFALALASIAFGILMTGMAMIVSINGMGEAGITCAIGAGSFILLGFIVNAIGVPLLLILFKSRSGKGFVAEA